MRAGTKFVCYLSQIKPSSKISRPFKRIKVCKLYIYIHATVVRSTDQTGRVSINRMVVTFV
jgi:hypothetical protein